MLSRDMGVFCDVLADGDVYIPSFGMNVAITIAAAPGRKQETSPYKDSMSDLCTEKTQEVLLQPFRGRFRGFEKVKVEGLVSPAIAQAVEAETAQDAASDPDTVISESQAQKDEGSRLFRSKKKEDAVLKWQDAALEIEQLHEGSSWVPLIQKGGVPFVTRLAKKDQRCAHPNWQYIGRKAVCRYNGGRCSYHGDEVIAKGVLDAFQWQPTDVHLAKFYYRLALFMRLSGDPSRVDAALGWIKSAHRLLPIDVIIADELETILEFKEMTG